MADKNEGSAAIDAYIATFPEATQRILEELRATIRAAAPDAQERIAYGLPTFALKGNLVHFGAWKDHIGFYPTPSGITAFSEELARYPSAKGSVQFPINEPLPLELVSRIVKFRVAENLKNADAKTATKKSGAKEST